MDFKKFKPSKLLFNEKEYPSEDEILLELSLMPYELLEKKRIYYESRLEKAKFSGVQISVAAIVVTMLVVVINIGIYKKQAFSFVTSALIFFLEICLLRFANHLVGSVEINAKYLKSYEYEINLRDKEKEAQKEVQKKIHLQKQAIIEKREKVLHQKYRK